MYVKLFSDILFSSIWGESAATRLLWITFLALADQDGVVRASRSGLARAANIDIADTEKGLAVLMAADPDSKSQREEGRRIIAIPDGFLVVNYLEYRRRKTNDDRREETRARVAKHRAAKQLARQTALELQEAHVTNVTRLAAKAEDTSADSGDLSPVSGVTLPPPRRPNLNRDRQLARPDTPVTQHVTAVTHVTPSEAEAEAEAKAVNGRMGFREGDTSHDVPDDLMALPLFAADAVLCRRWPRLSMALRASYPGVDLRNILADAHAYLPRAPRQYKDLGRFLGNQVKMAADSLARRGLAQQARPARRE